MALRQVITEIEPPAHADPHDVDRAAQQWSDEFLECRTYGHHWQPSRAQHNKRYGYWHIVQICPRCTAERNMELSERFAVLSMWIDYPEGYLLQGLGRITGEGRDMLRAAVIQRTFPMEELSAREAKEDVPHSKNTREAIGYTGEVRSRTRTRRSA